MKDFPQVPDLMLDGSPSEARVSATSSPTVVRRLKKASMWAARVVFLIGLTVLLGWLLHLPLWANPLHAGATMKPNTAFGLLLAGASLMLMNRETQTSRHLVGKILAALVLTLGLLTGIEYLFNSNAGIDDWLVAVPTGVAQTLFPSRMSPVTAFCFVCVGLGLLFIDGKSRGTMRLSEIATLSAILAVLLGIAGYAYGKSALTRIGPYASLSIYTALAVLLLGGGILAARPRRGLVALLSRQTGGAQLVRRLLSWAILIPLMLGFLQVKTGETGYFGLPFGTALLVTSLIAIFVGLICWAGLSIERKELAKQSIEDSLRESETRYRSLFNSIDEGFCVIEVLFDNNGAAIDYRFLEINPAFEKQAGMANALGKRMREYAPDQDSEWFDLYGKVTSTGEPVRHEGYFPSLHRWFDVYAFRVGRPEERKVAVLFTNITERKQAELATQRLATIVESTQDAIISKDLNSIIMTWNIGAERLFGHKASEAIGQSINIIIPPINWMKNIRSLSVSGAESGLSPTKRFANTKMARSSTFL